MSEHRWDGIRRVAASLTSALILALSVAVPMLDAGQGLRGHVLESEHHGASCVVHDHTVCTQFGANLPLAGSPPNARRPITEIRLGEPTPGGPSLPADVAAPSLPRAPPTFRA